MTAHLILVEDNNVLGHWEIGWGGRMLDLEDSYLVHPVSNPRRFGSAREKSF